MKTIFAILALLFASPLALHAGAPLIHMVLADKFLEYAAPADAQQTRAFIVGNLFPGIKNLGVTSREETHEEGVELQDISASATPFISGLRLHVCVDEIRKEFIRLVKAHALIAEYEHEYTSTLMKHVEDEVLFELFSASKFISYFDEVLDEEIQSGIDYASIRSWHAYLQNYFSKKPSEHLAELAAAQKPYRNISTEVVKRWSTLVPQLAKKAEIRNYVTGLLGYFGDRFEQCRQESPLALPAYKPLHVVKVIETQESLISVVEDAVGNKAVVKQIKNASPAEQFLLVMDALACSLGCEQKIHVNQVSIIPAGVIFPGKTYTDLPATFHTWVEGACLSDGTPWPAFDIHQRHQRIANAFWDEWEQLPQEKAGLTYNVIHHMSKHHDLPSIVALDTFVSNPNRSHANLFFNYSANSFCGIDMAYAFQVNLPQDAIYQIHHLKQKGTLLSNEEHSGLEKYRETLATLLSAYSIDSLQKRLDAFATAAGFLPGSCLYTKDVVKKIAQHNKSIQENYENSLVLLASLEGYLNLNN